jgi:hypothetical protein
MESRDAKKLMKLRRPSELRNPRMLRKPSKSRKQRKSMRLSKRKKLRRHRGYFMPTARLFNLEALLAAQRSSDTEALL